VHLTAEGYDVMGSAVATRLAALVQQQAGGGSGRLRRLLGGQV
jgi:hypothetical protein